MTSRMMLDDADAGVMTADAGVIHLPGHEVWWKPTMPVDQADDAARMVRSRFAHVRFIAYIA